MIPSSLGVLPQAQPWAHDSIDVESINQATGQALVLSVQSLRAEAQHQSHPRTRVHLVLGPPGGGKTHLFGRIRRKLGPRATLVHLRPLVGADIRPRYLVSQVFGQLAQVTHEVTQIDSLVGSLIARTRGADTEKPRLMLEDFRRLDANDQNRQLERIVELSIEARPDLDEAVLRAILQLPILPTLFRTATMSWLSGFELDPAQSARTGISGALPNERLISALRTLAAMAATTAPLVLVFDQLENLIDANESDSRVRAYANLIAELVDTVPGLVLIEMAVDADWARDIEPRLGQAQKSRVLGQRQLLELPTESQHVELLQRWVQRVAAPEAPFPWPFSDTQIKTWTSTPGMTPRMLMLTAEQALQAGEASACEPDTSLLDALDRRIDEEWRRHLELAREQLDQAAQMQRGPEPEHLHDALLIVGSWLSPIFHTDREGALCLNIASRPCRICLLHDVHPRTIAARLRRYLDVKDTLFLLREQWRPFPSTWHAVNRLADTVDARDNVTLHWVSREDITNLLALRSLVMQARSHDLVGAAGAPVSDVDAINWVRRMLLPEQWPLIVAITQSNPEPNEPATWPRTCPPTAPDTERAPDTIRMSQRTNSHGAVTRQRNSRVWRPTRAPRILTGLQCNSSQARYCARSNAYA